MDAKATFIKTLVFLAIERVKLFTGNRQIAGGRSPCSLDDYSLATYDKGTAFDHSASPAFVHVWRLPLRTQAVVQPHTP